MMRAGFIVSRSCRWGKNFDKLGLTNGRKSLPALLYAQVVKTTRRRRLVRVSHRVVFGTFEAVQQVLAACGWQINTAYAGLAPMPRQSGTSVWHRPTIGHTGNGRLRTAFYMATLSAAQHNPLIKAFYTRLRTAGGSVSKVDIDGNNILGSVPITGARIV